MVRPVCYIGLAKSALLGARAGKMCEGTVRNLRDTLRWARLRLRTRPFQARQFDAGYLGDRSGPQEIGGRGDVRREITVLLERWNAFAQTGAHALERRARRHRRMEVAALRRGNKLDCDDIRSVFRHWRKSARAVCRHRYVVFLVS